MQFILHQIVIHPNGEVSKDKMEQFWFVIKLAMTNWIKNKIVYLINVTYNFFSDFLYELRSYVHHPRAMISVTFGQFEAEKLAIFRKRNEGKPYFRILTLEGFYLLWS